MHLELSHFEVVLHICILLNFLYAISDEFSEKVFPLIGSPFKEKFNNQLASCSIAITNLEDEKDPGRTAIFKEAFLKINQNVRDFTKSAEKDTQISPKFRSVYLFAGLYSFLLLLHAGLHEYFLNPDNINCIVFYSDIFTLIFYTYAFIITFRPNKDRIRTLRVFILFAVLLLFQIISYATGIHHIHYLLPAFCSPTKCLTNTTCKTFFSLVIVLLPILLHIIRSLIKLIVDSKRIRKDLNEFQGGLSVVQNSIEKPREKPGDGRKKKNDIIDKYNKFLGEESDNSSSPPNSPAQSE